MLNQIVQNKIVNALLRSVELGPVSIDRFSPLAGRAYNFNFSLVPRVPALQKLLWSLSCFLKP